MAELIEQLESIPSETIVIVVPPLTWQRKDNSYIRVHSGISELIFF